MERIVAILMAPSSSAAFYRLQLPPASGAARWLSDSPLTLDELGAELSVSRERVRQVEVRALEKARAYAASHAC